MPVVRVPIDLAWPYAGSPGVNIWHLRVLDENELTPGVSEMLGHLHTFYTAIAPFLAPGTTVNLGDMTDVANQNYVDGSWTTINGPTSGSAAPQALQLCVSWRTSLAARRGMGRTFLGPLAAGVASSTDGTPLVTAVDAVQDAVDDLVSASQAAVNGAIGVYGYQSAVPAGGARNENDPRVIRDILQGRVRNKFAVLKSRRD